MSKKVDTKPGIAAADRVREKFQTVRTKREQALDRAFDPDRDFDTPTNPVIVIRKGESPKAGWTVPQKFRPYIIGAVVALALTGAGLETGALVDVAKLIFGLP